MPEGELYMRHTTQKLTPEQKESLFHQHKDLIYMIFCCNGYMLRQQVRKLFRLLSGRNEKDIEFDIAELICTGFLLQKTINKDTRTQMLYLSKYPKSQFLNVDSRDVAAVNWSEPKIFTQLFRIDYIIEKLIPDMKKQDLEIAQYDREMFEAIQLKKGCKPAPCMTKVRRDTEMDSLNSDIEKSKQFYSLKNFASHGFYIESVKHNIISICYFDNMNSIYTKKLYQQLSYILLMFQRYLNNYNLHLCADVYTWDEERAEQLRNEENKRAFVFYRQEWVKENKKHKIMKDLGILPSNWNSITVNYVSEGLYSKYNVHQ